MYREVLLLVFVWTASSMAAPITSVPQRTTQEERKHAAQDDPRKSATLSSSSSYITLTDGHQDITVHVGEQCRLIFPKMSGNLSSVYLKRKGSNQYVGGCRDENELGESLDPLFTGQVEQSDCTEMDEGFSLTFMSLAMNYTGTYIWNSGGKNSSITLNVTDGDEFDQLHTRFLRYPVNVT